MRDAKATECIYITYNPASDILPLQDEFARQERKIKEIASDERILLESIFCPYRRALHTADRGNETRTDDFLQ